MNHAQQSIDAIVQISAEDLEASALPATVAAPYAFPMASSPTEELPRKHRNRKRLFLGLQRISSSPSLAKMRPSNYRSGTGASMSCVSLSSTSSFGLNSANSLHSDVSQVFSTAPTSVAGSPGPSTPHWDARPRARTLSMRDLPSSIALPSNVKPGSPTSPDPLAIAEAEEYFPCHPVTTATGTTSKPTINFWNDLPSEIRLQIFECLTPKEIIKCSAVSKAWHDYCFDGQLWQTLDVSQYYRDIPADALVKVISRAGPFVRDLNLRGCVQLHDKWSMTGFIESCQNIENFSVEGCAIDRASLQCVFLLNPRLVHINVSGLPVVTNAALKIIGQQCPNLQVLNLTWCQNVDTRGVRRVIEGCHDLKDLRLGEIRGWDDTSFALELYQRNTLERLVLTNCDSLNDQSLTALIVGQVPDGPEAEIDWLTGRYICPPRTLKHLDLTKCKNITDDGLKVLAHNMPQLQGLQVSKCAGLTETSLINVLPTLPALTHLDLEELSAVTDNALNAIASSPAASNLRHLSISYCEAVTDTGMVPFIKACKNLAQLDMDNTRVSDLCLIEAAALIRERNRLAARVSSIGGYSPASVRTGLKLVVYDCPNVTWMGVREVLSRNAELASAPPPIPISNIIIPQTSFSPIASQIHAPTTTDSSLAIASLRAHAAAHKATAGGPTYAHQTISLKAFYTWQPTINEHAKRINACEFHRARRLERKWAEYMMCGEEVSQNGSGSGGRRRRRRMREALEAMAGEETDEMMVGTAIGGFAGAIGRRRRARSAPLNGNGGGCSVM